MSGCVSDHYWVGIGYKSGETRVPLNFMVPLKDIQKLVPSRGLQLRRLPRVVGVGLHLGRKGCAGIASGVPWRPEPGSGESSASRGNPSLPQASLT